MKQDDSFFEQLRFYLLMATGMAFFISLPQLILGSATPINLALNAALALGASLITWAGASLYQRSGNSFKRMLSHLAGGLMPLLCFIIYFMAIPIVLHSLSIVQVLSEETGDQYLIFVMGAAILVWSLYMLIGLIRSPVWQARLKMLIQAGFVLSFIFAGSLMALNMLFLSDDPVDIIEIQLWTVPLALLITVISPAYWFDEMLIAHAGWHDAALRWSHLMEKVAFGPYGLVHTIRQAEIHNLNAEYEQSLAIIDRAIEQYPDTSILFTQRANALLQLQRYHAILEMPVPPVSEQYPQDLISLQHIMRAQARTHMGDYQRAIDDFELALHDSEDISPANETLVQYMAHLHRGITYTLMLDYDSALRDFQVARDAEATALIQAAIAVAYVGLKKKGEAIAAWRTFEQTTDPGETLDTLLATAALPDAFEQRLRQIDRKLQSDS